MNVPDWLRLHLEQYPFGKSIMMFNFAMAPTTIVRVFLCKLIHNFLFSDLHILPGNAALVAVSPWMILTALELCLFCGHLSLTCHYIAITNLSYLRVIVFCNSIFFQICTRV